MIETSWYPAKSRAFRIAPTRPSIMSLGLTTSAPAWAWHSNKLHQISSISKRHQDSTHERDEPRAAKETFQGKPIGTSNYFQKVKATIKKHFMMIMKSYSGNVYLCYGLLTQLVNSLVIHNHTCPMTSQR